MCPHHQIPPAAQHHDYRQLQAKINIRPKFSCRCSLENIIIHPKRSLGRSVVSFLMMNANLDTSLQHPQNDHSCSMTEEHYYDEDSPKASLHYQSTSHRPIIYCHSHCQRRSSEQQLLLYKDRVKKKTLTRILAVQS